MGNCGSSIDCYQCYGADECLDEIEVDADIAGIGVLVAFLLAASATCAAIIYGYLTDSLPESLLSDTGKAIIPGPQNPYIEWRTPPWFGRCWLKIKSLLYICTRQKMPDPSPPISRERRVEAFTRFILAFSDQQMATGLAMMIAALANSCHLNLYEVQTVFYLAWFSATVHLTTLKVLREYLFTNKAVRNWRLIGTSVFMVLICFFQIVLTLSGDLDQKGKVGFINYATLFQCIIDRRTQASKLDTVTVVSNFYVLVFPLLDSYIFHAYALFVDPREIEGSILPLALGIPGVQKLPFQARQELLENAKLQQKIILRQVSCPGSVRQSMFLRRYRDSFLSYVPAMVFSYGYGFVQTLRMVWSEETRTTVDIHRMGFGQVVALALLFIPALTVAEVYHEAKNSSRLSQTIETTESESARASSPSNDTSTLPQQQDQDEGRTSNVQVIKAERIICQYLQDRDPSYHLEQKRLHLIAISLLRFWTEELNEVDITTPRNALERKDYIIQSIFSFNVAAQYYLVLSLNAIRSTLISAWVLMSLYLLFYSYDAIKELKLLRSLVRLQVRVLEDMAQSKDDHQEDVEPRPTSSQGIADSAEASTDSIELSALNSDSETGFDPPVRQDTEADIAVIPRPHDDT